MPVAEKKTVFVRVTGRVQGVWYRASTAEQARGLGLCGWVRNTADGAVELHLEGDPAAVDRLIAWCRGGPPLARVKEVNVQDAAAQGFTRFEVR